MYNNFEKKISKKKKEWKTNDHLFVTCILTDATILKTREEYGKMMWLTSKRNVRMSWLNANISLQAQWKCKLLEKYPFVIQVIDLPDDS